MTIIINKKQCNMKHYLSDQNYVSPSCSEIELQLDMRICEASSFTTDIEDLGEEIIIE